MSWKDEIGKPSPDFCDICHENIKWGEAVTFPFLDWSSMSHSACVIRLHEEFLEKREREQLEAMEGLA